MSEKKSLLSAGAKIAGRNKRYVIWFYLLNLTLASFGAAAFRNQAHAILDHSLYADKLLHGFHLIVLLELLARPDFGPTNASTMPAFYFALLFFLATMLFLPGVLLGYASDHRLPRYEFYRTCGQNIWRFVRLFLFFVIIAGPITGILGAAKNALAKAADQTSNERLPFFTQLVCLIIIFLVLTAIRIWFDLAQTRVVIRDEGKVRKSIAAAYRSMKHQRVRLLGSYVLIAFLAVIALIVGIWIWIKIVPAASVLGAFIVGQVILLVWLAARFWQRACAVAFYLEYENETPVETLSVPETVAPIMPGAQPSPAV
ncbi:MAG TPA: hypothetical protein VFA74_04575 [Terriglobales bacterium]|nr:hypothetical protein [Terriglobales bacterium]